MAGSRQLWSALSRRGEQQAGCPAHSKTFCTGGGRAFISVNKALVTQASSAIPVVPLYISILYKLMKARGTHEGCIEQIYRMDRSGRLPAGGPAERRFRARTCLLSARRNRVDHHGRQSA